MTDDTCVQCEERIDWIGGDYITINRSFSEELLQFHTSCFVRVAGEEYIPESCCVLPDKVTTVMDLELFVSTCRNIHRQDLMSGKLTLQDVTLSIRREIISRTPLSVRCRVRVNSPRPKEFSIKVDCWFNCTKRTVEVEF